MLLIFIKILIIKRILLICLFSWQPDIKPPPELIHPTDNYDGEQQLNQWGYYGDIIFGLEETQRILEQIREGKALINDLK
jgi:hypothetical protein